MLLAVLALAAVKPTPTPVPRVPLQHVAIALPSADEVVVTLVGRGQEGAAPELAAQRLRLGDVVVPLASPPDLAVTPSESRVTFKVVLRQVGEGVLALNPYAFPVRWEGLGKGGRLALVLAGLVNLADRAQVQVPIDDLTSRYARLADYSANPSGLTVGVRLLLNLYNPFSFEVVATGLQYRLEVGGNEVLASQRPGFRLRAAQWSDILVEQDVPLVELASSMAAFLARKPAVLNGVLAIRTPKGERRIPVLLHAGM